jgi:hypothetical protein
MGKTALVAITTFKPREQRFRIISGNPGKGRQYGRSSGKPQA